MATARQALTEAAKWIGTVESPFGSNRQPFAALAGHANGWPWCGSYLVAVMRAVGIRLPSESAYTPAMAQGFVNARRWSAQPSVGALAFFNFPDRITRIQHVGIVESFTATSVTTIDGNTSATAAGSQSNGGGVFRRTRSRSFVVGYGLPAYTTQEKPKVPAEFPSFPRVASVALNRSRLGGWLLTPEGKVVPFGSAQHWGQPFGRSYWGSRKAARIRKATVRELARGIYYVVTSSAGQDYKYGKHTR